MTDEQAIIEAAAKHIASRYLSRGTRDAHASKSGTDKADDVSLLHHDPKTRAAIHLVLRKTHEHVFSDKTKTLAAAKEKHAAVLALSKPDDEPDQM